MPAALDLERLIERLEAGVKVSIENFVKVTLMAILGFAVLRIAAEKLNVPGLSELVN